MIRRLVALLIFISAGGFSQTAGADPTALAKVKQSLEQHKAKSKATFRDLDAREPRQQPGEPDRIFAIRQAKHQAEVENAKRRLKFEEDRINSDFELESNQGGPQYKAALASFSKQSLANEEKYLNRLYLLDLKFAETVGTADESAAQRHMDEVQKAEQEFLVQQAKLMEEVGRAAVGITDAPPEPTPVRNSEIDKQKSQQIAAAVGAPDSARSIEAATDIAKLAAEPAVKAAQEFSIVGLIAGMKAAMKGTGSEGMTPETILATKSLELDRRYGTGSEPLPKLFDRWFDEVPALAGYLVNTCKTRTCKEAAYGLMVRVKGLVVASLSRRERQLPVSLSKRELAAFAASRERVLMDWVVQMTKQNKAITQPEFEYPLDLARGLRQGDCFVDLYHYQEPGATSSTYLAAVTIWPSTGARPSRPEFIPLVSGEAVESAVEKWKLNLTTAGLGDGLNELRKLLDSQLAALARPGVTKIIVAPDNILSDVPWFRIGGSLSVPVHHVLSWYHLADLRNPGDVLAPRSGLQMIGVDYGTGPEGQWAPLASGDGFAQSAKAAAVPVTNAAVPVTAASLELATRKVRYIHFGTHGIGTVTHPVSLQSFDRSYLALSQANADPNARLTATALGRWNLTQASLLTLAACHTVKGDRVRSQGSLGLANAAVAAGARNVMASLWKVSDSSSNMMLSRFYPLLFRGKGPRAALLEAQRETAVTYPVPLDWAGWVLLGID